MTTALTKTFAAYADALRQVPLLQDRLDDRPAPRSPAAKFAGLHAGLPQCERQGVDMTTLCGEIDPDDRRE